MKNTKSAIAIFVVYLLITNNLFAISNNTDKTYPFNKDSKALQFQINSNFTLGSFQGTLISYKKHFSDKKAIRIGISLSNYYQDGSGKGEDVSYNDQDSLVSSDKSDITDNENKISFSVISQLIRYGTISNNIVTYWGIGPKLGISYSRYYDENELDNYQTISSLKVIESSDYNVGASCVFGLERFFKTNISIIVEYRASLVIGYKKYITEQKRYIPYYISDSTNVRKENINKSYFSTGSDVKFGLSVYF